ncbi:probable aspartyl aminopeptidase isoform X2 [Ricinus communis]|uniref:probable aspartyl aminopeptidase isoform X2 n=1 Tax=Ricinus communis TaxID=3988 RepID=UPI000772B94E|nr:probable aspartyl aminopeptidase isoform X2 [Ricinus communis]|eukprot:XP_015578324.1 probable aspartyl aminopeptidase isoform X2 [Ricinus communis]
MAAMSMTRLQLLHPLVPIINKPPSLFLSKLSHSPLYALRPSRNFSSTRCSTSNQTQTQESCDGSIVGDLLDYLNESWTQFHATAEAKRQLIDAGFHLLNENDEWDLKPGGRYFFTRNMSCLVAFAVGEKYTVGNGFHVIAAHTDSPCLKLKPKSASSKSNYLMVNVQTYGGGLWHTWFDRDLSVAGRVIVRGTEGSYIHKLVKVERPLLRVPTLAIHLDRTVNTDGFKPNLETHLIPLFATKPEETSNESKDENSASSSETVHHPLLMQILSEELSCNADDIVSIELNVCDTQASCLGGGNDEFIFSGRLDNLASSFCALRALIDSCKLSNALSSEPAIRMVAFFDNEEVGSGSVQGAGAPTMFQAMRRIVGCLAHNKVGEGAVERAIRQSFLVSADMAHGVHPNFVDKHEEHHRPEMQKGLVIKHNANQRYATNGITAFLFKEVGNILKLPTQEFVVRNDMGCGSTIGPILASGVGIRTIDCGIPQLSMHRC